MAVGVARLGSPSAFIGRVGNDPLGQFMQDTLNAENVNTQHMILDPQHRTSTVVVGLDNGERSFTFMVNPSADQFLQASDLPPFQQGEWLHCCSIALINNPSREATFEAIRRIKAGGGFFSFDPNLRESLWSSLEEMKTVVMEAVALADVLKFSEEELTLLTNTDSLEKAFEKVTALYPEKLIIVTLGKDGALYHLEGKKDVIAGKPYNRLIQRVQAMPLSVDYLLDFHSIQTGKKTMCLCKLSVKPMPVVPLLLQQKGRCLRYQIKHN